MSLKTTVSNYKKAKSIYKEIDNKWYDLQHENIEPSEFLFNQILNRLKDLKKHLRYIEISDLKGEYPEKTINSVTHNTKLIQEALYYWERTFLRYKLANDLKDPIRKKYIPGAHISEDELKKFGGNLDKVSKRFIAAITNTDNIKEFERAINRMIIGTMSQKEFNNIYDNTIKYKMIPSSKESKKFKSLNQYKKEINESMGDILRPKTGEEIIRDLSKLSQEEKNNQLLKASKEGQKYIVEILLKAGADVNTKNKYGDTALIEASEYGLKDIVEMLLKAGADVNAKNEYGSTALMWASRNGHKDIVEMLLKAGADVNAKNIDGNTALMKASENGLKDIVEILLKAGANVNPKNIYGNTALIGASYNGLKDIVEMLLKAGADVNAKNIDGNTALIWASIEGHEDIVEILLKAGADVNTKNKYGDTALIEASIEGHKDVVELLKKYEANEIN